MGVWEEVSGFNTPNNTCTIGLWAPPATSVIASLFSSLTPHTSWLRPAVTYAWHLSCPKPWSHSLSHKTLVVGGDIGRCSCGVDEGVQETPLAARHLSPAPPHTRMHRATRMHPAAEQHQSCRVFYARSTCYHSMGWNLPMHVSRFKISAMICPHLCPYSLHFISFSLQLQRLTRSALCKHFLVFTT